MKLWKAFPVVLVVAAVVVGATARTERQRTAHARVAWEQGAGARRDYAYSRCLYVHRRELAKQLRSHPTRARACGRPFHALGSPGRQPQGVRSWSSVKAR